MSKRMWLALAVVLVSLTGPDRLVAQASLKTIIVQYDFSEQAAPAGQLAMEVRYLTYGTTTARGSVRIVIVGTDTAAQIRTKILDAVVADVLAAHKVTITKPDILLPTYGQGS